jgi:hypothetical protein
MPSSGIDIVQVSRVVPVGFVCSACGGILPGSAEGAEYWPYDSLVSPMELALRYPLFGLKDEFTSMLLGVKLLVEAFTTTIGGEKDGY